MSMSTRIRCDACQRADLLGLPHITVGLRPNHPGSVRDTHFCDTACLQKHLGNLTGMLDSHVAGYKIHGERIRAARVAS